MRVKLIVEEMYRMMETRISDAIEEIEKSGYVLDVRLVMHPNGVGGTAMILYEERPDEVTTE